MRRTDGRRRPVPVNSPARGSRRCVCGRVPLRMPSLSPCARVCVCVQAAAAAAEERKRAVAHRQQLEAQMASRTVVAGPAMSESEKALNADKFSKAFAALQQMGLLK